MADQLRWKSGGFQVHGRIAYNNRTTDSLIRSYTELGVFPHKYHIGTGIERRKCKSHVVFNADPDEIATIVDSEAEEETSVESDGDDLNHVDSEAEEEGGAESNEDSEAEEEGGAESDEDDLNHGGPKLVDRKNGVSALTFDKEGKYLAAGTRAGCLTVYNFDSLLCHTQDEEDVTKQVFHVNEDNMKQINSIQWNPTEPNEIACGSRRLYDLHIYDCYAPSPSVPKITCKRRNDNVGWEVGLSDVAFGPTNPSLIVASDLEYSTIAVWDTRANNGLPVRQLQLGDNAGEATCVLYSEFGTDQHLFGGGTNGNMFLWDLRVGVDPMQDWSLVNLMTNQGLMDGHSGRRMTCIDSLNVNPSNQNQLAFHVNNGWSGVIDLHNNSISHIHRPLALPGLHEACRDPFYIRRCSWLANTSIYMAPSRNARGIFLLDFNSYETSPYHVESVWEHQNNDRGLIALSQGILTSAAHPLYDVIVAGTENTSLLVISQKFESVKGEESNSDNNREVASADMERGNVDGEVASADTERANGDGEVNDEDEDADEELGSTSDEDADDGTNEDDD